MKKLSKFILVVLSALLVVSLTACGNGGNGDKVVKVGISSSDADIWKVVKDKVKKEGIDLQIVQFNDYNQPNTALSQGQVDINAYQHQYFLDAWNKAHKTDIVRIGDTIFQPMAIYSNKFKSIDKITKGSEVALPNDVSNQGRALQLLQSAGLIKVKDVKIPSTKDVTENKLNLKFTPLDANQTARSLNDVGISVVNGNVASDAKLDTDKALYTEKVTAKSQPYVNFIATNKKDKDNKTYKKIVKAFQTKEVGKEIKKVYGKNVILAWEDKIK
ncbi:MetQ/NlpA family ABC transporter substrate-binding protein [Companilactobacillus metriopterae]|uniref:MetQ/NlpA family ABC transporter substrate-binding protein n=1 Tax=Companilactobacillus metriopterae TaxID=1909267 RepID=UPI00100A8034|nr:MetQ/NlpA family ABC transporter substrate-binding protein [Companilactobacillus metriopterae]